jgi:hypothetical protein
MVVNLSLSLSASLETTGYSLLGCPYPAKICLDNRIARQKEPIAADCVQIAAINIIN